MTTSLEDSLCKQPREMGGGAIAGDRLRFQYHVVLCLLLDQHQKSGEDYVFVLDHHDDVMICDSVTEPSSLEFVQIKSKGGRATHWTRGALVSTDGKKPNPSSNLGKLFHHTVLFTGVSALRFVSNLPFKLDLAAGNTSLDRDSICGSEVVEATAEHLRERIASDLDVQEDAIDLEILWLERSGVGLSKPETFARGRVVEFLDGLGEKFSNAPNATYRWFLEEISARARAPSRAFESFDELCERKGLSRGQFSAMIEVLKTAEARDVWDPIAGDVTKEWGVPKMLCIRSAFRSHQANLANPEDRLLRHCLKVAHSTVGVMAAQHEQLSLVESVRVISANLKPEWPDSSEDERFALSLIALQTWTKQDHTQAASGG